MNYEVGGFIRRMRHTLFTALAIFLFTSPSFALVRDPSIKMEWFRVFAKTGTNNEGRNFLTDITVDSNTVFEIELEIMPIAARFSLLEVNPQPTGRILLRMFPANGCFITARRNIPRPVPSPESVIPCASARTGSQSTA
ncbi:MAG: hypothetical protein E7046_03525 [Lentisphaerae bacterium]|nr:hypothetical protein [Lentisphaerota bacterium]